MPGIGLRYRASRGLVWGILLLGAMAGGCRHHNLTPSPSVPHELAKVALPPYVIESPDILQINAIRLIPKPPYRIEPLDALGIRVSEALPEMPIQGVFGVEADGTVNLGFSYGTVYVRGMTLEQAKNAIDKHLRASLKPGYQVTVVVAESRALQQIRGPHLVQTDGTVNLGLYGAVFVDNMTIPQAKAAIEAHMSQFLVDPEISLTVAGYNSKVFYVITDGGGLGDQITRLPVTGKTTVLDALAQISGVPAYSGRKLMWVARPGPSGACSESILPVRYFDITRRGDTSTNYQLLPGDRLYIQAAPLIVTSTYMDRVLAPLERIFGLDLLINAVIGSNQSIIQGTGAAGFGGAGGVGAIR
jgi:polysaccharide export outer membrane protein